MSVESLLSGANKIIGLKQTTKAIKAKRVAVVFVAKDAEARIKEAIINACNENNIAVEYMDTMEQLGKACGIEVGAATAAILKS
jgi:Ribosomal protein L7Ae/L30e/S12e/Gadd45 family.